MTENVTGTQRCTTHARAWAKGQRIVLGHFWATRVPPPPAAAAASVADPACSSLSGIDVNARNAKGQTALCVACTQGSPGLVKILLAHPGVEKVIKDKGGTRCTRARTCVMVSGLTVQDVR